MPSGQIKTYRWWLYGMTIGLLLVLAFLIGQMRYFEEQSATLQAFPAAPQAARHSLPAIGKPTQYGVYINDAQMAQQVNADLGAGNLSIVGLFEHWKSTGVSNVNKLQSICAGGFTPLISWESWGGKNSGVTYELADIAAGKYDALMLDFFRELNYICEDIPVIIRFDHEMEMRPTYGFPWTPWQGKPDAYIQAWRHAVTVTRNSGYHNIKWLWSPNRADKYVYDYYPGSDFVDYVGMTLNHPTVTGTVYGSFEQFYAPNRQVLESFNKPIIIGEAAYYNFDEQRIAAWIDGAFDFTKHDGKIVALVWFNQPLGHLNYSMDATPAGREAFIRNMRAVQK